MSHKFSLSFDGGPMVGSASANQLEPGCHAVVMPTAEQADAFILSCAGLKPTEQGQVRIGSQNPYTTPKLRAQIVSLLAQELEPELWSKRRPCSELFSYLLSIQSTVWSDASRHSRLMDRLAQFKNRLTHTLSGDERRVIMLEFALAHPSPKLALLYEPWTAMQVLAGQVPERDLLNELSRLVQTGCIVVLLTVSEHQAERYSEHVIRPSTVKTTRSKFSALFRGVS